MGRKPIEKTPEERAADAVKQQKYIDEWCKENATRISIKLMNKADADIIEHLETADSKQGEIKRLLRLAMALEAEQNKDR